MTGWLKRFLGGKPAAKFEVFRGGDAKFYFRLKAANGEIVCASEGYHNEHGAQRGAQAAYIAARQSRGMVVTLP